MPGLGNSNRRTRGNHKTSRLRITANPRAIRFTISFSYLNIGFFRTSRCFARPSSSDTATRHTPFHLATRLDFISAWVLRPQPQQPRLFRDVVNYGDRPIIRWTLTVSSECHHRISTGTIRNVTRGTADGNPGHDLFDRWTVVLSLSRFSRTWIFDDQLEPMMRD